MAEGQEPVLLRDAVELTKGCDAEWHCGCGGVALRVAIELLHARADVEELRAKYNELAVNDGIGPIRAEVYCKAQDFGSRMMQERDAARAEVAQLREQVEHYRNACAKMNHEVTQALGKALGYPPYGPEMFENGEPDGSVCVGDHVAESLADEAAAKIGQLRERIAVLESHLDGARRGFYEIAYGSWAGRSMEDINTQRLRYARNQHAALDGLALAGDRSEGTGS